MQNDSLIDTQGGDTDTRYDGLPDSGGMPDISGGELAEALAIPIAIYLIVLVIFFIGLWKMFAKGGIPGILGVIPIVNLFFLCKLAGKPTWWGILYFVPLVQIVIAVLVSIELANRFGRGAGTALGLIFLSPIFACILGFGSAQYSHEGGTPAAA